MRGQIIIDALALVLYAIVSFPALTTIGLHEWLGIGLCLIFIVHMGQHWTWIIRSFKFKEQGLTWGIQGRLVLDIGIAVSLVTCAVSGIFISGSVLPSLGYYAEGYYFWNPLHSISAKFLLSLLIVHFVLNAKKAWKLAKGYSAASKGTPTTMKEDQNADYI